MFKRFLFLSLSYCSVVDHLIELWTLKFPKEIEKLKEEILEFLRKRQTSELFYVFWKKLPDQLTKDEIFMMLHGICRIGTESALLKNKDILPEYINIWDKRESLISVAKNNFNIMKILLDVPNVNFEYLPGERLEFFLLNTKSFPLILEHPKADLNCKEIYDDQKISLLMEIVLSDDIENFYKILQYPNIDVNYRMKVDDESEEIVAFYSVIHYLVIHKEIKMLEILLKYPTVDRNILSSENFSPRMYAMMISFSNRKNKVKEDSILYDIFCSGSKIDESPLYQYINDIEKYYILESNILSNS